MNWYYVDAAGQQAGPVDDAGLDALLASGKINAETLVWKEGMANWQSFREIRPASVAAGAPAVSGIEEAVCAECGGIFPITNTVKVGNGRVCTNCKPAAGQKLRGVSNVENAGSYTYAGFWVRFAAAFLDGLILGAFNIALNLAVLGSARATGGGSALLKIILLLLELAVGLSYETFFIGKYGATLGKMACKIQVIAADGSAVGYGRSLGRYLSKLVSTFTCLIGYIIAGFDSEKRALHDRMCNTRVIYK